MRRRDIAKALVAGTAGIAPASSAYASDRVGLDVRGQGAIGNAAADDRDAIVRAAATGSAVYFPRGTYRIARDLTIEVPCLFDHAAVLRPDPGVSVRLGSLSNRVFVNAGPWQLFDLSNGGSAIRGACSNREVYAEWFGAIGDGSTDDGAALQNALDFCMSSGYIPLQLLAKNYVTRRQLWATNNAGWNYLRRPAGAAPDNNGVPIRGVRNSLYLGSRARSNVQCSTISVPAGSWRNSYGLPILSYIGNCFDANIFGEKVRDVHLTGDANCVGIMAAGACGLRARGCSFDGPMAAGIRWENGLYAQCYTEYTIAENCWFGYDLTVAAHYSGPGGSMHGSGLADRCLINRTDHANFAILVAGGVQPYNAVMDVQIWHSNNANPCYVFDCKNPRWLATFFGNLTLEAQGSQPFYIGSERDCAFSGTITALQNTQVHAGSCVIARGALSVAGQGFVPVFPNRGNAQALRPGTTTLQGHDMIAQQVRLVCVKIVATRYRYCHILALSPGNAVAVIATLDAVDTAGYGPPAFGLDGWHLTVTNPKYPATGVTAYWGEQCIDPCPLGTNPIGV